MTTTTTIPGEDTRRYLNDLRVLIEAFAGFDLDALPHELRSFKIQVASAAHRFDVEAALTDYGFTFGPVVWHEVGGGTYSDGTQIPHGRHGQREILRCGRHVGHLYGTEDAFVPSTQATVALLDAIHGDVAEWDEVPS